MSEVRAIRAVSAEDHDWSGERAERRADADRPARKKRAQIIQWFRVENRESLVEIIADADRGLLEYDILKKHEKY